MRRDLFPESMFKSAAITNVDAMKRRTRHRPTSPIRESLWVVFTNNGG